MTTPLIHATDIVDVVRGAGRYHALHTPFVADVWWPSERWEGTCEVRVARSRFLDGSPAHPEQLR